MMNMKALKGEESAGTDAEACAYLYIASLTAPMNGDWSHIYLYLPTKTFRRWGKGEMPTDVAVDSLGDYQMGERNRLKDWLHRQRIKATMEKDRAERRQKREEADTGKKTEQPTLFEF